VIEQIGLLRQIKSVEGIRNLIRTNFESLWAAANVEMEEENRFHQRIVQKAMEFINANYTKVVSLQDVAEHVSISKNYMSELFKKVTGQNFIDYLIQLRLNRAKELLKTSTLKIYEVAEISGFNDVKYFSKLFKKIENMSPAEYRETGELCRFKIDWAILPCGEK
jgi:two-component system response regulator YesN